MGEDSWTTGTTAPSEDGQARKKLRKLKAEPAALHEATSATVNAWVGLATLVLVVTCIGYVLLARLLQELPI